MSATRNKSRLADAGVDQRADVGVARRHHAVERRDERQKAFERVQAVEIGLGGHRRRRLGGQVVSFLVRALERDRLLIAERCPAFGRNAGESRLRHAEPQVALGLLHLLFEIGRVDHRQDFASLHAVADVMRPALQIAVDPRINRRVIERLHIGRQNQLLHGGGHLRRHQFDGWRRRLQRQFRQIGVARAAR